MKTVGGTATHWADASLWFQKHEWKAHSSNGEVKGATLPDRPIDAAEMDPWYTKSEDKPDVTRTGDRPGLPGSNNYLVFEKGAKALGYGYKAVHTGRMVINSDDIRDRLICQQTGFCFQGCKWGAKWSAAYTDIPEGEATGNLEVRERTHVPQRFGKLFRSGRSQLHASYDRFGLHCIRLTGADVVRHDDGGDHLGRIAP